MGSLAQVARGRRVLLDPSIAESCGAVGGWTEQGGAAGIERFPDGCLPIDARIASARSPTIEQFALETDRGASSSMKGRSPVGYGRDSHEGQDHQLRGSWVCARPVTARWGRGCPRSKFRYSARAQATSVTHQRSRGRETTEERLRRLRPWRRVDDPKRPPVNGGQAAKHPDMPAHVYVRESTCVHAGPCHVQTLRREGRAGCPRGGRAPNFGLRNGLRASGRAGNVFRTGKKSVAQLIHKLTQLVVAGRFSCRHEPRHGQRACTHLPVIPAAAAVSRWPKC